MEELAAVGGEFRPGASGESVSDGLLGCGERGCCRPSVGTETGALVVAFRFEAPPCDLLGMDGGICGRRDLARYALGQLSGLWCTLCTLLVAMARTRTLLPAPADLRAAR